MNKTPSPPEKRARSPRMTAPCLMIAVILLCICAGTLTPEELGGENLFLSLSAIQLFIFALPAVFYAKWRGKTFGKELKMRLPRPSHIPFTIYATLLLIFLSLGLKFLLHAMGADVAAESAAYPIGSQNVLYAVLALAIVPAITEEFLLRSVLLSEYEPYGPTVAVVTSGLLFASLHFSLPLFPVYFAAGALLAFSALATRSIVVPLIAHTVYNLFALFFESYLWQPASTVRYTAIFVLVIFSLLLLFLGLTLGEASRIFRARAFSEVREEDQPQKKRRYRNQGLKLAAAVGAPPFLICLLLYVIAAFASL